MQVAHNVPDGYVYGDTNHQFRSKSQNTADTGNEFIPVTTSGKTYNAGDVLGIEDDAAYVASKGKMRMPTEAEYQELIDNTTNQWVSCSVMGGDHSSHNVMGRLFTSKTDSSKTLFFPAGGCFTGVNGIFCNPSMFFFWSSSVCVGNINSGSCLFSFSGKNYSIKEIYRFNGNSVRGVLNN